MKMSCRRGWAVVLVMICGLTGQSKADQSDEDSLIAYWNFNSGSPGAAAIPADTGTGLIDLSGWNGPSDRFGGTTLNALNDDPAGDSLALVAGQAVGGVFPGNHSYLQIDFSMANRKDLHISFATRGSTGSFTTGRWWWSIDGEDYQFMAGINTATTSSTFELMQVDFSSIATLNNHPSVSLRYWLSGATSSTGAARLDNLQIHATLDQVTPPEHAWAIDDDGVWSDPASWTAGVPSGAGTPVRLGNVISQDRMITVDAPHVIGMLTFDHMRQYTLVGPAALTIDVPVGGGKIAVVQGSHTILAPLVLAKDIAIEVASGAKLTLTDLAPSNVAISKTGQGSLQLNSIRSDSLIIDEGLVQLLPNGSPAGASEVGTLAIAAGATLDLTNNSLLIMNGDIQTIANLIKSGRTAAGDWTGAGIVSSAAAAEAGRELGFAPDGPAVRVRFTWAGDANLDGSVGIADLGILAANWQQSGRLWHQGDFNFDGAIGIADLGILAANWQKGPEGPGGAVGVSFAEAMGLFDAFDGLGAGALDGVTVPEPASAGAFAAGMVALLCQQRRARRRFRSE